MRANDHGNSVQVRAEGSSDTGILSIFSIILYLILRRCDNFHLQAQISLFPTPNLMQRSHIRAKKW